MRLHTLTIITGITKKIKLPFGLQNFSIFCVKNTRLSPARSPFFSLNIKKFYCQNVYFIISLILSLFFCSLFTVAQTENTEKSTNYVNSISRDRVLVELNYTGWDTDFKFTNIINDTTVTISDFKQKWYNRGLNLYFTWDIPLGNKKSSNFAFSPGLGVSIHNVYTNARPVSYANDSTAFSSIENVSSRNNKFTTTHVEVPLEFRFRTNPDKFGRSWKAAVGLRLGILTTKNAKFKGTLTDPNDNPITVKEKMLDIKGMSRYRVGPSVRLGYGNISIVGYMSLIDLFETNKGPKLRPFSIGITFNSY